MNARNAADQILSDCLQECMQQKQVMIDEEMEQYEDYIFSDEFETGMKELLVVRNKKTKSTGVFKYAVSMAAALLVVVGIVSASATSTKATLPTIDILGWFDTHFEFSKGTPDSKESEFIFDEEQITYIPEGFIKIGENRNYTHIKYEYKNSKGAYFGVYVSKAKVTPQQDNEEITRETFLNDDGYECLYIEREDEEFYYWEDSDGLFYRVYGNAGKQELNSVMNGIQYKGEDK
ncbi:MAG: DUF4367 domain-containing protein [Lachnospiraceae bacterium]|nr:DUF4367 domain-containing protein [Lachnospiraceae bacterium]